MAGTPRQEAAVLGLLSGASAVPPLCPACEQGDGLTYHAAQDAFRCRCGCLSTAYHAVQTGLRLAVYAAAEER